MPQVTFFQLKVFFPKFVIGQFKEIIFETFFQKVQVDILKCFFLSKFRLHERFYCAFLGSGANLHNGFFTLRARRY